MLFGKTKTWNPQVNRSFLAFVLYQVGIWMGPKARESRETTRENYIRWGSGWVRRRPQYNPADVVEIISGGDLDGSEGVGSFRTFSCFIISGGDLDGSEGIRRLGYYGCFIISGGDLDGSEGVGAHHEILVAIISGGDLDGSEGDLNIHIDEIFIISGGDLDGSEGHKNTTKRKR